MLLAQTLVFLLERWDLGLLTGLPETLVKYRVPIVLIQILSHTLTDESTLEPDSHQTRRLKLSYIVS